MYKNQPLNILTGKRNATWKIFDKLLRRKLNKRQQLNIHGYKSTCLINKNRYVQTTRCFTQGSGHSAARVCELYV